MLRFSSRLIVFGALLAGSFVRVTDAQTWRQIGNFPADKFRCAYFWDPAHGVIAGDYHIFYYNSGVWKESVYPEMPAVFRSLRLLDGKNLYAASGSTCVWESTDSGATWELTSAKLVNADDVYLDPSGNIQGMNITGTGMTQGTSFARVDSHQCAAANDDNYPMLRSTDGGYSWLNAKNSLFGNDGYNCYADPCTGKLYTIDDDLKAELFSSSDGGETWDFEHDFITSAIDVLDGADNIVYVQGIQGIFQSLDGGYTFSSIGGPGATFDDRRIFTFGPGAEFLIDIHDGDIWLWDGGPYSIFENIVTSTFEASLCEARFPIRFTAQCVGASLTLDQVTSLSPEISLDSDLSRSGPNQLSDTLWFDCSFDQTGKQTYYIHIKGELSSPVEKIDTVLALQFNISAPAYPQLLSQDTITVISGCSKVTVPLVSPCGFHISSILPLDSAHLGGFVPNNDTFYFAMSHYLAPGKYSAAFRIYYSGIAGNDSMDAHLNYRILPNSTYPSVTSTSSLTLSNCRDAVIPIYLKAPPCDSVRFTSCSIAVSNGIKYSKNLTFARALQPGEMDTLLIDIPPQNLSGNSGIAVHLQGYYAGSDETIDTELEIRLSFTSSSAALIPSLQSAQVNSLPICSRWDTTVTFQNDGCDTIFVIAANMSYQPDWTSDSLSFPIILPPDSGFRVRVYFSPSSVGTGTQEISYIYNAKGNPSHSSAEVVLTATVVPAVASLSLNNTALDFGTFSRCNASADTTITLTNSGCDSLSLSGASVGSGSGFILVDERDTVLAPNQSVQYRIHFSDSITGSLASALYIHAAGAHGGNAFDTSIALSAAIVSGTHIAALNRQAIDFGITSICEERDSSIAISNTGCEKDTITRADLLSTQFVMDTTFPIIISPGETVIVPISTNLDTVGRPLEVVDTLDFVSNADSPLPPVVLSRGVNYPGHFSLGLKTEDSAAISATVPVYVLRHGTIPKIADELDFDLIYNDDLLGYSTVIEPDVQPVHAALLSNGLTDRSFTMKPATDRDTIATVEFKSYLAKQEHTPITLSSEKFISGGIISPPCVASIDSGTNASFTLELACGDAPLANALSGLPIDIASMNISPGAVSFTLDRGDAALTSCSAEVLSILGSRAVAKTFVLGAVTSASLDIQTLPPGVYFLRLSAGRCIITRRFVIVK